MNNGIQPTVELATNNGAYPYPIMYGNGFGANNGFLGGDGWIVLLLLLAFGNGGFGGFGGFGGGMYEFPWLLTGQNGINNNVNDGFDNLHLSNQIEGTRDAVNTLANSLCTSTASINSNIANGFYNSEIAAANRQMANMNTAFDLSRQFADCCCENRLGIANLGSDIAREACATRTSDTQNTQSILNAITGGIQSIKDEIFRDRIDEKDSKIADLNRQLSMADLKASQVAQNAFISNSLNNEIDLMYNRLVNCPIPSTPVYGRTAIFSCPQNNGCGCGFNTTSQFI